ncbi:hypothetical protein [Marinifilum fragile]|uniref:hypothetical protein n=1 Tax=Marinifilum fragile TaxID=570161 RepID=UPI0012FA9A9E|nr:hypothetical protein [Marinifilum fragile]
MAKDNKPLAKDNKPLAKDNKPLAKDNKPLAKGDKPLAKGDEPLAKNNMSQKVTNKGGKMVTSLIVESVEIRPPAIKEGKIAYISVCKAAIASVSSQKKIPHHYHPKHLL